MASLAGLFCGAGLVAPQALALTYRLWIRGAAVLGWINTRLILLAIFYLVFTPLGLAMRLCRVDFLERSLEKSAPSYWKKREEMKFHQRDYQRQF
jgi:multisubunit Na+/H+ antiporter MnhG subunit